MTFLHQCVIYINVYFTSMYILHQYPTGVNHHKGTKIEASILLIKPPPGTKIEGSIFIDKTACRNQDGI